MACGKFCSRCANSRSVVSAGFRKSSRPVMAAEFQQRERGDGIAGRLRAVVIVLHAQNQILRVGGALPETAVFRVVKFRDHRLGQFNGKIQMLRFQRGFVKFDDAGEQKRVAFEQLHVVALAVAPAVKKRAVIGDCRLPLTEVPTSFSRMNCQIFLRRRAIFFIAQNGGRRARTRRASGRSRTREFCRRDAGGCVWRARRTFSVWRRRAVPNRQRPTCRSAGAGSRLPIGFTTLKTFCPGNGCGWLWSTKFPFRRDAKIFRRPR